MLAMYISIYRCCSYSTAVIPYYSYSIYHINLCLLAVMHVQDFISTYRHVLYQLINTLSLLMHELCCRSLGAYSVPESNDYLELLYHKFSKSIMEVPNTTINLACYGEPRRFPVSIRRINCACCYKTLDKKLASRCCSLDCLISYVFALVRDICTPWMGYFN